MNDFSSEWRELCSVGTIYPEKMREASTMKKVQPKSSLSLIQQQCCGKTAGSDEMQEKSALFSSNTYQKWAKFVTIRGLIH